MGSSTGFRMEQYFRFRLMKRCGVRSGRPAAIYAKRFQTGYYRHQQNRGSGAKNASTQTIVGMCGNDKIRRLGPVRCRNPIREESPSLVPCKCCRMWLLRSGCNTVPHEKGTETPYGLGAARKAFGDATPSPTRRGL